MRLIDADVMREDWLENGENEHVYDTNAFLASIDEQPTIEAVPVVHEWIPCSERLPEDDTDVLICSGEFVHEAHFKNDHFSNAYGMWYKKVTHWQPLPEPYKGE